MALTRRIGLRLNVTPVGLAAIAVALALVVRSLIARNAYEIVVSAGIALLWAVLYTAGNLGARRLAAMEPSWKPPSPLAANTQEETLVTGIGFPAPWFFRLHVILKGRFFPSGARDGCSVFLETAVPDRAPSASINLSFPMSGVFQGEGSCRLCDIFGFFAFRCGRGPQQRTVNVRGVPTVRKQLRVDPQSGAEDRRSKASDDEERYYMREYAPGDRFRDINWKSSERINTLITRISPDTHEKTCLIEVLFRNYGPTAASLDALWLLDRAKARLTQFLRLLKESDDKYVFSVHAAQGAWVLETMDEIEAFLEKLAALPFSQAERGASQQANDAQGAAEASPHQAEAFVFTTAYDDGLQAFVFASHPRPLTVFLVETAAPVDKRRHAEERGYGEETLAVTDFVRAGCVPKPRWFFWRETRRVPKLWSTTVTMRLEREYADTCLWKQ